MVRAKAFYLVLSLFLLVGCQSEIQTIAKTKESPKQVLIVGNHAYISLNFYGRVADNPGFILRLLQNFELEHQDLKTTNWKIQDQQGTYLEAPYVYGLWIDFEKR